MDTIKAYHFTGNIKLGFEAFYNRVSPLLKALCFDLEDSIAEEAAGQVDICRGGYSKFLIEQLLNISLAVDLEKLGIRVNPLGSAFYENDVFHVSRLNVLGCVFLPKVDSPEGLSLVLNDLPAVKEIIPIIETQNGFNNIHQILSVNDPRFKRIAFGHCDYNFSINKFPFIHQNDPLYWEWLDYLHDACTLYKKELLNSPVLDLGDPALFKINLSNIQSRPMVTGQITLCESQSRMCAEYKDDLFVASEELIPEFQPNGSSAYQLITEFDKGKVLDRTFALTNGRQLISPQEYRAALNYNSGS